MEPATHIIGKQNIQLRYNGYSDVLALRQLVSSICADELPARLNRLLDEYDEPGYVLRIDRLDVRVRLDDDSSLREKLARKIVEEVEIALRQKREQRSDGTASKSLCLAKTLAFYLGKGYLPRYSGWKHSSEFIAALEAAFGVSGSARIIVREAVEVLRCAPARTRLLGVLSASGFDAFVISAGPWSEDGWKPWQQVFQTIASSANARQSSTGFLSGESAKMQAIHEVVLEAIAEQLGMDEANQRVAKQIVKILDGDDRLLVASSTNLDGNIRGLIALALREQRSKDQQIETDQERSTIPTTAKSVHAPDTAEAQPAEEGESIFIQNAGLVLLAPFLPAFFSNLALMDEAGRPNDADRAVTLLRYLVYGNQPFLEMEAVFEKLLCGIPLSQSLALRYRISEAEQVEADALLQTVIEHWSVLKATSPDGLRHNFLQREGKLSFEDRQWKLVVQRHAQDILLEYLPWNIGMIKLNWMPELISVKWQS